jgi:hypothetical protein
LYLNFCFQVKKYNFDMIEQYPKGPNSPAQLFCSLNCLRLLNTTPSQPTFIASRPPTQTGTQVLFDQPAALLFRNVTTGASDTDKGRISG